ncbi:MAG: hypothetical protein AAGB48_12215 [Planctomycetota bacterium]
MTSTQSMLTRVAIAAFAAAAAFTLGCAKPELVAPTALVSPYDASRGEVLWAVAPLANESGATIFDPNAITDSVIRSVQQIDGIRCLPLNRVLAEMRALEMAVVGSPAEAAALADRLGVNGLIIGTITDYDPYEPPTLGLSLALETTGTMPQIGGDGGLGLDALRGSVGETGTSGGAQRRYAELPTASVSVVYDARSHATLMALKRYAQGRHDPMSARGWQRFLMSMPLYTDFAAHAAVSELLDHERLRLARAGALQVSSR